jgi:hypothetical protein
MNSLCRPTELKTVDQTLHSLCERCEEDVYAEKQINDVFLTFAIHCSLCVPLLNCHNGFNALQKIWQFLQSPVCYVFQYMIHAFDVVPRPGRTSQCSIAAQKWNNSLTQVGREGSCRSRAKLFCYEHMQRFSLKTNNSVEFIAKT